MVGQPVRQMASQLVGQLSTHPTHPLHKRVSQHIFGWLSKEFPMVVETEDSSSDHKSQSFLFELDSSIRFQENITVHNVVGKMTVLEFQSLIMTSGVHCSHSLYKNKV
jgi:hypothetical protein